MLPRWIYTVIAVWIIITICAFTFTWSKCGSKTLILGNGGFTAAATGMCDE